MFYCNFSVEQNVATLKAKVEAKNTPTVTPPSALKRKADGDVLNSNNKEAKGGFVIKKSVLKFKD